MQKLNYVVNKNVSFMAEYSWVFKVFYVGSDFLSVMCSMQAILDKKALILPETNCQVC